MWDSFSWHIKLSAVHFFLVCGLLYAPGEPRPGDEGSFKRPVFSGDLRSHGWIQAGLPGACYGSEGERAETLVQG